MPCLMAVRSQKLSTLSDTIHFGRTQSPNPIPNSGWLSTEADPYSQIQMRNQPVCWSKVK